MKKWHYFLIAIACFTVVGLLIWWNINRKKKPKELSPQLKQLQEDIQQQKEAKKQKAKPDPINNDQKMEALKKELKLTRDELEQIKNDKDRLNANYDDSDPANPASLNKVIKINQQRFKQPVNLDTNKANAFEGKQAKEEKVVSPQKEAKKEAPSTKLTKQLDSKKTTSRKATEAEVKAYSEAKKLDTLEAYQAFLKGSYGSKTYNGAVTRRINQLKKLKEESDGGE